MPSADELTTELTMRYPSAFFAISLAALLFVGDAVIAQTTTPNSLSSPLLSKRALRQQDKQECTKQAAQQNVAERNQAIFIRKCMADRQGARKAKAKEKASK